jgi:hypothetical protein
LNVDSEVLLVPSLKCRGVFGFEEDAANAGDSLHFGLLRAIEVGDSKRSHYPRASPVRVIFAELRQNHHAG